MKQKKIDLVLRRSEIASAKAVLDLVRARENLAQRQQECERLQQLQQEYQRQMQDQAATDVSAFGRRQAMVNELRKLHGQVSEQLALNARHVEMQKQRVLQSKVEADRLRDLATRIRREETQRRARTERRVGR